jgi:hypothetical protein
LLERFNFLTEFMDQSHVSKQKLRGQCVDAGRTPSCRMSRCCPLAAAKPASRRVASGHEKVAVDLFAKKQASRWAGCLWTAICPKPGSFPANQHSLTSFPPTAATTQSFNDDDAAFASERMVRGQGPHGHAILLHCGRADLVGSPRSTQPGTGPRSCGGSSSTRAPATAAAAAPYTVVLSSNAATEPYLSWSALLALGCPHRPHLQARSGVPS